MIKISYKTDTFLQPLASGKTPCKTMCVCVGKLLKITYLRTKKRVTIL